ncbi:MAG TPA: chitobiase/beta-hexosaminidase C-terminal domain-containing protein [Ruminiclostridium sp.]
MKKIKVLKKIICIIIVIILFSALNISSFAIAPQNQRTIVKIYPKAGTYTKAFNVTLTLQKGYSVYFTLDNSNPSKSKTKYVKPVIIEKSLNLKYIYVDKKGKISSIFTITENLRMKFLRRFFAKFI